MRMAPLLIPGAGAVTEKGVLRGATEAARLQSRLPPSEPAIPVAEVAADANATFTACRAILAAIAVGALCDEPRSDSVVVSVLLSYVLQPIVSRLESYRLPRAVAVPLVVTALVAAGAWGVYGLGGQAARFVDRLPDAAHVVATAIHSATRGATSGIVGNVRRAAVELEAAASAATKKSGQDGITSVRIEEPTFKWSDWFWRGSHSALELVGQSVAVLCLLYFLLMAGDLFKRKLVRMVPSLSNKRISVEILAEIDRQIERFIVARVSSA